MKRFLCTTAFLVLFAWAFLWVNWLLQPMPTDNHTHRIADEPKNSVDVLFVGSSQFYCGVNPTVIWNEQGIPCYNYTSPAQDMRVSYYYLLDALRYQTPELVVIDLFSILYPQKNYILSDSRIFVTASNMEFSLVKLQMLNTIIEADESVWKYLLGTSVNHNRWRNMTEEDIFKHDAQSAWNRYKGYSEVYFSRARPVEEPVLPYPQTAEMGEIAPVDEEYLHRILELSKTEGFQVLALKTPVMELFYSEELQARLNTVQQMMLDNGAEYLDANERFLEIAFDTQQDFFDGAHLNKFGAEKMSTYLGEYLTQNYSLVDRRGDARYTTWDEAFHAYQNASIMADMLATTDPYAYFSALQMLDNDMMVLMSARGSLEPKFLELQDVLRAVGSEWDVHTAIENGDSYVNIWAPSLNLKYEEAKSDIIDVSLPGYGKGPNVRVISAGYSYGDTSQILIDGQEWSANQYGVNIVIYDLKKDAVFDAFSINTLGASEPFLYRITE